MNRSSRSPGVTLIEVIVALGVLAINLLGWHAALHVIFLLLQRASVVLDPLALPDLIAVCALGAPRWPQPYTSETVARSPQPHHRHARVHCGLTLVEVLLALALSSALLMLLAASFALTVRGTRTALGATDEMSVRLALPEMLRQAVEGAGRGVTDGCALAFANTGRRIVLTYDIRSGERITDEVFADSDGGGRPALYVRRVPHPRQPWIEDVTSFGVVGHEVDGEGRIESARLALEHLALDEPLEVLVALPHRPCLEATP